MSLSDSNGTPSMCRLDVIWEGYCHNFMDHLVEETKAGIRLSLLKGSLSLSSIDVTLDL